MPTSSSRFAYDDCYAFMERALTDGKGIRIKTTDYGASKNLQGRIHAARTIDREGNKEVYDFDHPMHGRSAYDKITTRIIQDGAVHWVQLEVAAAENYIVESLSKGDEQCELPFTDEPSTSPIATSEATPAPGLRRLR